MFAIQYMLTNGEWKTIDACGTFDSLDNATDYMMNHCASIVHKRVEFIYDGKAYVWTLDSHDCFGPFTTGTKAKEWMDNSHVRNSPYQIFDRPPFMATKVWPPSY